MESQFGPTLRRMRQDRMVSQSSLAKRADLEHSFISRLEAGGRNPSQDTVASLADAMGLGEMERALLFASAGFAVIGDRFRTDPDLLALAEILWDESLDVGHREQVRGVLRAVANLCTSRKPARLVA